MSWHSEAMIDESRGFPCGCIPATPVSPLMKLLHEGIHKKRASPFNTITLINLYSLVYRSCMTSRANANKLTALVLKSNQT